jgi:hypothetical protein
MSSIQQFQDSLKDASLEELLAIIAVATAEAKKKAKIVVKAPKKEAKEKKGSMPKGVVPPQLVKPRAYVDYTLADANKNGWEAFEISGQPFAASVLKEGVHVFEATGKPFNHKHAMSLSKIRKTTRPEFYQAFEEQHVEPDVAPAAESEESDGEEKAATAAVSAPKPKKEKAAPKPKKTDEEKAAEKEAKKEAKKAEKKTSKKEASSSSSSSALTPRPQTPEAGKEAAVDTWVPKTTDGKVYPRVIGGVVYFSNHLHELWVKDMDGGVGDWAGKFLVSENRIDATAEEPIYD